MHIYRYTVIFEPNKAGGYTVTCPTLPGVVTEGDTLDEARDMAKDAMKCYQETLQKDGLPIPTEKEPTPELVHELVAVNLEMA